MYYAPTPPPPHIAGRSSAAASTLRVGVPFANELHQQNAADLRFTRDNLREYVHLCRIGDAQKGPTGGDEIGDVSASLYKSAAGPAAVAPAAPSVTADEDGMLRRIGSTGSSSKST